MRIEEQIIWSFNLIPLINTLVFFYILYRLYQLYLNDDKIKNLIMEHYKDEEIRVDEIEKLKYNERLRYGLPLISIFRIYSYFFGILTGKIDYNRRVEITDKNDVTSTRYVELIIRKKDIISFREFDSYNL